VSVWIFWRYRFVDRFLGTDLSAPTPGQNLAGPKGTAGS
jgi:hypothetical protein